MRARRHLLIPTWLSQRRHHWKMAMLEVCFMNFQLLTICSNFQHKSHTAKCAKRSIRLNWKKLKYEYAWPKEVSCGGARSNRLIHIDSLHSSKSYCEKGRPTNPKILTKMSNTQIERCPTLNEMLNTHVRCTIGSTSSVLAKYYFSR